MGKINLDPDHIKQRWQDWVESVAELADQVSRWCADEGWVVERHDRTITEKLLGTYTLPELSIRLTDGEILLVPIGLSLIGGNGRVNLEAIPTLARVKLIRVGNGWSLFADTNVPLRQEWNRQNFIRLAQDLLG